MEKKVLDFLTVIEQGEDGWYIAKVPDIPGCYTQGKQLHKFWRESKKQ